MENGIHSSSIVQLAAPPTTLSPTSPLSPRKSTGGWRAIKYILANESFEKLASMSLIANLTVYLHTKYNLEGIFLVNVVQIWSGSSNIMTLAGAFISDAYWGRYRTLLFGSISSLLGMAVFALSAGIPDLRPSRCAPDFINCPQPYAWQLAVLFGGLGLLAVGAGGVRPCNIAFGADQFDTNTAKGKAQLESFFNWWYFSFTASLVIALTIVVYIQTNINWLIGFIIPTACLFLSVTIFLIGRSTYVYIKPQGSIFIDTAKVVTAAFHKRKERLDSEKSLYDPPWNNNSQVQKLEHSSMFKCLDKAALIVNPSEELDDVNGGTSKNGWRLCSVQQVEQCKCLVRVLPVWVTAIGCFISMDQQNSLGILQSMQMDRTLGFHRFEMPPAWLGLTSMIALSIWILVYERVYIPMVRKLKKNPNFRLTMRQRINIGLLMAIMCQIVASIVERKRRLTSLERNSFIAPLSVALLVPQFVLSGLIEAFAAVALMEYFTITLPESMRTLAGSIFFLSASVGSYMNSVVVNIVHKLTAWVGGHDLNVDKLDYYYGIIAGFAVLNLLYFNLFAHKHLSSGTKVASDRRNEEVVEA